MLLQKTLRAPPALLALPLALLLTACGTERPAIVLPPADRLAPVAFPAVPDGEALCDDGAPCLSDRQVAGVMADLANALDLANAKILWLADWARALGD
ncbi:MAG: hypothetical protein AB7G24_00705 [Novosphingobium sp.]